MWRMTHMVGDERGRSGEVRPRAPWGRAGPASARTNVVESKATRGPLRQARILPAPTPRNDISILPPSLRLSPGALPRTRRRTGRGEAGPSLYSSRGGGGPPRATLIIIAQAPEAMQETFVTISPSRAHNLPITLSRSPIARSPSRFPRQRVPHLRGSFRRSAEAALYVRQYTRGSEGRAREPLSPHRTRPTDAPI